MNYHAAFGFGWWRIAAGIHFTFTTDRIGLGGGMVLDPMGDHPNFYANVILGFFLVTVNVRLCAHAKDHA